MANQKRKLNEMFYEAVRERNYQRVTKLARAGADVNQVVGHGWTPVVTAVVDKDRKMCQLLLSLGARPAFGIQAETGALDFACGRDADSVATIKALVEHGVPPDRLIHSAAGHGTVGTVRQLLKRGADPNLLDFHGHRPLRHARSVAVVQLLFCFGADPLAYSSNNEHPLHFHATWGHANIVRALLAGGVPADYPEPGPPDQPDIGEAFALHMSVSHGYWRSGQALLEGGANCELLSRYHIRTPLMMAAFRGDGRIVNLLLQHGADANRCVEGDTARSHALEGLARHPEKAEQFRQVLALLNSAGARDAKLS